MFMDNLNDFTLYDPHRRNYRIILLEGTACFLKIALLKRESALKYCFPSRRLLTFLEQAANPWRFFLLRWRYTSSRHVPDRIATSTSRACTKASPATHLRHDTFSSTLYRSGDALATLDFIVHLAILFDFVNLWSHWDFSIFRQSVSLVQSSRRKVRKTDIANEYPIPPSTKDDCEAHRSDDGGNQYR